MNIENKLVEIALLKDDKRMVPVIQEFETLVDFGFTEERAIAKMESFYLAKKEANEYGVKQQIS